ncbi:MAG: cysteine desulfurase family protein [Rhizobiaceae bacterium]
MIYLDANATTRISRAARAALLAVVDGGPHNPSSAHRSGSHARSLLERARQDVADALGGCDPDNVFFTSGGTEGNNLAIRGFSANPSSFVFRSAVEHASVSGPAEATGRSAILRVEADGIVDVASAAAALRRPDFDGIPILVCVQAANSETGIVQPVGEIAARLREIREFLYLHVDAAQALGRTPLSLDGVDSLSFSGHKLHAPTGTGFLYLSDRMLEAVRPILHGGGQEGGVRPGTQNVAGACALAAALADRMEHLAGHAELLRALRDRLEAGVTRSVPGASVIGATACRIPNTANIMFPGQDAQALLARLDAEGVCCSTGSACSSARPEASPVLKSMGMSEREASSCLRFSVSVDNTPDEIDEAVRAIVRCAADGLRMQG